MTERRDGCAHSRAASIHLTGAQVGGAEYRLIWIKHGAASVRKIARS